SPRDAADWRVSDKTCVWVAYRFGLLLVTWDLDDAPGNRLGACAFSCNEQVALDARFRDEIGFDHAYPSRVVLHRCEVRGGLINLLVGHRHRKVDHRRGVGLAPIGAAPESQAEIVELTHDVGVRQPAGRRVLGASLSVWQVARAAAARALTELLRTVRDDVGHRRRMIAREPVDDVVAVAHVDERVRRARALDTARAELV